MNYQPFLQPILDAAILAEHTLAVTNSVTAEAAIARMPLGEDRLHRGLTMGQT